MLLQRPLPDNVGYITQYFGARPAVYAQYNLAGHNGLDYGAPRGTSILACHAGTATVGYDATGYGNYVRVSAPEYTTIYAHMSSVAVVTGQVVTARQLLGHVGSTGNSTGNHLHLGVKFTRGRNPAYLNWVDPLPYRYI